jgi:hypothetical protein
MPYFMVTNLARTLNELKEPSFPLHDRMYRLTQKKR